MEKGRNYIREIGSKWLYNFHIKMAKLHSNDKAQEEGGQVDEPSRWESDEVNPRTQDEE